MDIIKVSVKQGKKPKAPRGITRAVFAMAVLFAALCQLSVEAFGDGRHCGAVVMAYVVFGSLSGLFFLVFLGLLLSKIGDL